MIEVKGRGIMTTVKEKKTDLERAKEYERKAKEIRLKHKKKNELKRLKSFGQILDVIEDILQREFNENDVEKFTAFIQQQENRGNFFSKAMSEHTENIQK